MNFSGNTKHLVEKRQGAFLCAKNIRKILENYCYKCVLQKCNTQNSNNTKQRKSKQRESMKNTDLLKSINECYGSVVDIDFGATFKLGALLNSKRKYLLGRKQRKELEKLFYEISEETTAIYKELKEMEKILEKENA